MRFLVLEEREVYAAVCAEIKEVRVAGEIVLVAVLKNKQTTLLQQREASTVLRFAKDERWQSRELVQCVGWVSKDKIVADRA